MWPVGLDFANNTLIVADAHTGRIYLLDEDLQYISSVGGIGPSDNLMNFPYCAVYIEDRIYIADVFNDRILELNNAGEICRIWGEEITDIPLDIAVNAYANVPYTYGLTDQVESTFFNPCIDRKIVLGYDSLFFFGEDNSNYDQINSSNYLCNQNIFEADTPRIDQMYLTWIKRFTAKDGEEYLFIGSPELAWQYYIYNINQNVFYVYCGSTGTDKPVWYVDGSWYSTMDIDAFFNEIVDKAAPYTRAYTEKVEQGFSHREAYAEAFLDYYNSVYYEDAVGIKEPMTKEVMYDWIDSFFLTENGSKLLKDYIEDGSISQKNLDMYYQNSVNGTTNLCELLFVKMYTSDAEAPALKCNLDTHNMINYGDNGEVYEINDIIEHGYGHCGVYATILAYGLRELGYKCSIVGLQSFSDYAAHSVVEVEIDDRSIVLDPTNALVYDNSVEELCRDPAICGKAVCQDSWEDVIDFYANEGFWAGIYKIERFESFVSVNDSDFGFSLEYFEPVTYLINDVSIGGSTQMPDDICDLSQDTYLDIESDMGGGEIAVSLKESAGIGVLIFDFMRYENSLKNIELYYRDEESGKYVLFEKCDKPSNHYEFYTASVESREWLLKGEPVKDGSNIQLDEIIFLEGIEKWDNR